MLILVGPSASGKTEVVKLLIEKYNMKKLVTYTSRPMRVGEVNHLDYHFLSKEEFVEKIKSGFFLEYVEYNGNYYGTSYEGLDPDKVVILEPSGLKHYLESAKDLVKICYITCSKDLRKQRMIKRGDSLESIKMRLSGDDLVFTDELNNLADWVINDLDYTLEKLTAKVYELYKEWLNE
ncbi:MAG: AAA family ATPase [Bacilli bacterium]|nr:AAA family ATPase [Bacilli bacterium]